MIKAHDGDDHSTRWWRVGSGEGEGKGAERSVTLLSWVCLIWINIYMYMYIYSAWGFWRALLRVSLGEEATLHIPPLPAFVYPTAHKPRHTHTYTHNKRDMISMYRMYLDVYVFIPICVYIYRNYINSLWYRQRCNVSYIRRTGKQNGSGKRTIMKETNWERRMQNEKPLHSSGKLE